MHLNKILSTKFPNHIGILLDKDSFQNFILISFERQACVSVCVCTVCVCVCELDIDIKILNMCVRMGVPKKQSKCV